MGLLDPTKDAVRLNEDDIAMMLAESAADLNNEDQCLEAMIAHGVKPTHFSGDMLLARDMAKAIRRASQHIAKSFAAIAPLLLFTLSILGVLGLASPAEAAERGTFINHFARHVWVVAMLAMSAAGVVMGLAQRNGQ